METGWVRISRTCNNACLFCSDADQLDGQPVPLEAIQHDIDGIVAQGARQVVLSGGEPTLSRHLLAAIRYAKERGLSVALTTNGRIIQSDKIAQMLEKAGLDEIRVSVHAARRQTHETLVQAEKAWVESTAAVKYMGRTSVRVRVNAVITRPGLDELAYLMHLLMMGGMKELNVRWMLPVGRATSEVARAELVVGYDPALKVLSDLWFDAKEEVILLTTEGLDHTVDLALWADRPLRQADTSALRLLRQRVLFHHALRGFTMLDEESMAKDFVGLVEGQGGFSDVGHELAARQAPLVDAPACVGGRPRVPEDHWGADAVYGADCGACLLRPGCAGLPKKLTKLGLHHLRPLPWWSGVSARVVVLTQGDPLLSEALREVAAELVALGVDARTDDLDAAAQADAVVCGGGALAGLLALPGRREDQRVEVVDIDLGASVAGQSDRVTVLRQANPGLVQVLTGRGLALRQVHWRPALLPSRCAAAPWSRSGAIVALGRAVDWVPLVAAVAPGAQALPKILVFDHAVNPCPRHGLIDRHTDASDEAKLAAIGEARFVVYPHRRTGGSAEELAVVADDLRWLAIAQAAGRPVVAIRGPGVDDGLRQGRTAVLVRPGEAADLAGGIRALNADAPRMLALSEGARAHGALSLPAAYARELVSGAAPSTDPCWKTTERPWPVW